MSITEETWLPSYKDLKVPELNVSSAVLRAGAYHMGKHCDEQSKEFMLCRSEEKDPRMCLTEGKAVTKCAIEFYSLLKKFCGKEFTNYWKCIDRSQFDQHYRNCRTSQKEYDLCVLDNLDQERPPLGYFAKVRIHKTNRPKPELRIGPLPSPTPELDPDWMNKKDPETMRFNMHWF